MNPELHARLDAKLLSLRQFLTACPTRLQGARLVQYRDVDFLRAIDVPLAEIESQVTGSFVDGFRVDWACRNGLLYLRVFDFDGPTPSWERLFAEEDLAAVRSILLQADPGEEA